MRQLIAQLVGHRVGDARSARAPRWAITLGCAMAAAHPTTPSRADDTTPPGWTTLAGGPDRCTVASGAATALGAALWTLSHDAQGQPISFAPGATIVASPTHAYALGEIDDQSVLMSIDLATGSIDWTAPIDTPFLNSWSSPSLDGVNETILVASDLTVTALDAGSGDPRWQTTLDLEIANATPAITADLPGRNRALITDYDPFFGGGSLYCINTDAFDASANPFAPGEIVWSVVVGETAGSTPAYANGVVYLATAGPAGGAGTVLAFDATSDTPPAPLWSMTNPKPAGFYGGVAVCEVGGSLAVYAASYSFFGGQRAGNLVKIDAATGSLVWSIDANRTDAIPVVLPGGWIVLSGGVWGFGAVPSVQLFNDHGSAAELLWDSALATWDDLNTNGAMDPGEILEVGGWTHQPLVVVPDSSGASGVLYAGAGGGASFEHNDELLALDLGPAAAAGPIVLDQFSGAGSSPAFVGGVLLTVGPTGLVAFGSLPPAFDVNLDGTIDVDDMYAWHTGIGQRDVNRDGVVDAADAAALEAQVRKDELTNMIGGRR